MTAIIDTITEYEEKALELIVRIQDEILNAVKQAVSAIDERLPEFEIPESDILDRIPTLAEIVDTQFAFSKKLLANQEKFVKNVVKTVKPLTREGLAPKPATKTTKAASVKAA